MADNFENSLNQFRGQNYLNLETFRKSGAGVPTPVWFVEDDGVLLVYTEAQSGKVKRIRNNRRVRVVPSDGRGAPLGQWVEAEAEILDQGGVERVNKLMKKKYGLLKTGFEMLGKMKKAAYAAIAIKIL